MLLKVFVFLSVLSIAYAALALGIPETNPYNKKEEGCFIEALNYSIPFDKEVASKDPCMSFRCSQSLVEYESCGPAVYPKECKVINNDEPYPKCCKPKVECPKVEEDVDSFMFY